MILRSNVDWNYGESVFYGQIDPLSSYMAHKIGDLPLIPYFCLDNIGSILTEKEKNVPLWPY